MGTLTEQVTIKIGGKDYSKQFDFRNIVITQQLLRPNELTFTMEMRELDETGDEYATTKQILGAEVVCTILTNYFDEKDELKQERKPLIFEGIVANVDCYRSFGPFSIQKMDVLAYSKDFLLMDHNHCYSYENMLLKDIVKKTLSPYKINDVVEPWTQEKIPYTVQYNETNYEFLSRLAIRYGEWMYNDGVQWIFGQRDLLDPIQLNPRNDILNFRFFSKKKLPLPARWV